MHYNFKRFTGPDLPGVKIKEIELYGGILDGLQIKMKEGDDIFNYSVVIKKAGTWASLDYTYRDSGQKNRAGRHKFYLAGDQE